MLCMHHSCVLGHQLLYTVRGLNGAAQQWPQQTHLQGKEPPELSLHRQFRRTIQTNCAELTALPDFQPACGHIIGSGSRQNIVTSNRLISMYGRCGYVKEARMVFDQMGDRNVVSWTAMIAIYSQHGYGIEALQLFQEMIKQNLNPNKVTVITALTACACPAALEQGKMLHALIMESGFETDVVLSSALVNMYGKCGSVRDAQNMFDKMDSRNLVSWNVIISVYTQLGHCREAMQMFRLMLECLKPDKVTFVSVLSACAGLGILTEGQKVHSEVIENGFESSVAVQNALLDMYGKCGSVDDASRLFKVMHQRDVISWNTMIAAYTENKNHKAALQLFQHMKVEAVQPDKVTFVTMLHACALSAALDEGRLLHYCVVENGIDSNIMVGSSLVDMYGRCGNLEDASTMFMRLHVQNLVVWNTLIAAYAQWGCADQALQLFHHIQSAGMEPDNITFVSILSACASMAALAEGNRVHVLIIERGFESDDVVASALVNMYSKCGCLEDACTMFNKVHLPDVVLWTALIAAFCQSGHFKDAVQVYHEMRLEGIEPNEVTFVTLLDSCEGSLPDGKVIHSWVIDSGLDSGVVIGNALVNMYGKCGSVIDAQRMFDRMSERNVVSWSTIITLYAHFGHGNEGLQCFKQMNLEGVKPNEITFVSTLSACASMASLAEGKIIHASICESGLESNEVIQNALVNMYGKCGSQKDALRIFNKVHQRNVVSWNVMIAACAQYGLGKEALQLRQQMEQDSVKPDEVTFLSILSACSHAGLLQEGCHIVSLMSSVHGILPAPNHYACLIDLFGRAGQLHIAENFVKEMPSETGIVEWMTLVGACQNHGDVDRGQLAAKHLLKFDPQQRAEHTIKAAVGRFLCG